MSEDDQTLPAYSLPFLKGAIRELSSCGPLSEITPDWAWGGSTGKGVRVAVVDTGIEHDHRRCCRFVGVVIEWDEKAEDNLRYETDDPPHDVAGMALPALASSTACAGSRALRRACVGTNMSGRRTSLQPEWIGRWKMGWMWST
jgi:hypothetical protein